MNLSEFHSVGDDHLKSLKVAQILQEYDVNQDGNLSLEEVKRIIYNLVSTTRERHELFFSLTTLTLYIP